MIKLTAIQNEVTASKFKIKASGVEQEVDFGYYPNGFTPKLEEEMQKNKDKELAGELLIGMLCPLLAYIDIETDDKGTKIEITSTGLSVLPINILNDIMTKINEELNPGKAPSDESAGSFKA